MQCMGEEVWLALVRELARVMAGCADVPFMALDHFHHWLHYELAVNIYLKWFITNR